MAKSPGRKFCCHHSRLYPISLICGSYCTELATGEMSIVFPLPTGPPVLLPPAGSPPNEGHVANSGCGTKYTSKHEAP